MNSLELQSERQSATGNVSSEGVLNQLGRPNLDLLAILVREAVQNSWDARVSDADTVHFSIAGRTLTDEQMRLLRQVVFANQSGHSDMSNALTSISNFQVLIVSDRGTTGLGGPTRADRAIDEAEQHNFVNFLRNVGQPTERHLGGGTFGYGKAALYLMSSIRTICVHTHCLSREKVESRFIAAALGPRFETKDQDGKCYQYTGRHWWGKNEEGIVEPIRGSEADELARHLGLPEFVDEELGTSILILLPILGEHSLLQTIRLASIHLLWNCWPKMLQLGSSKPSMSFSLAYEGESISIPDPHAFSPLQGFALAMESLKGPHPEDSILSQLISIECYNPKQHLGQLSLQKFPAKERLSQLGSEDFVPFNGLCHHVALMRKPELVVKYIPGPPLPSGQIEYAGVFIVDEEVDKVFANAEPPTHDDWAYQSLNNSREKTFVRVAFKRIQEALQNFTQPQPTSVQGIDILPLGAFADRLGGLILGAEGSGANEQPFHGKSSEPEAGTKEQQDKTKGKTGSVENGITEPTEQYPPHSRNPQKAKIRLAKTGTLGFVGDIPALLTEFIVEHVPGSRATQVKAEANAVLDGDEMEKTPPIGGQIPHVLVWIAPDKSKYANTPQITIPVSSTGTWGVAISVPDDTVINVNLTVSEVL